MQWYLLLALSYHGGAWKDPSAGKIEQRGTVGTFQRF